MPLEIINGSPVAELMRVPPREYAWRHWPRFCTCTSTSWILSGWSGYVLRLCASRAPQPATVAIRPWCAFTPALSSSRTMSVPSGVPAHGAGAERCSTATSFSCVSVM